MTQAEIRKKANRLCKAIGKVEDYSDHPVKGKRYRVLRQEWHALKAICPHPDRETKPQSVGSGTYTSCPDCRGIIATTWD